MWLTRLAISRPILIWMTLAAIAVLGIRAYSRLPAELNPRVQIPTLTVTTVYPGAGPPEIESQITKPLEDAVGTVGGVQDVFSNSQSNVSILSIDFKVGTNLDAAADEVRARVESVRSQLPAEARAPVVAKLDINALPIYYVGLESPTLSLQQLYTSAADTIRPRLERVAGVATIDIIGGEQREIHVAVDRQRLAEVGLTIEDVVNSLKAGGRDVPAGEITQENRTIQVRVAGAYTSLPAIRATQILSQTQTVMQTQGQTPDANAAPLPTPSLTVADVAAVTEGTAPPTTINRINGQEGVSLVFTKTPDSNTVSVVDGVKQALAALRPSLGDIRTVVLRDAAVTVRSALEDVNGTLVLGALLAMGVILLFLHNLRGTLIVSLAIPACIVATFLVIGLAGFTLNQMTLLALSLSVGILVDDSIVVLESITRHLRDGETPHEAALNGRAEIGFADMTTTLVDVVVFVPIAFTGGIVGGFFRQFGLTIATATLFSLLVSFTITPMLASRWYRAGEDVEAHRGLFGVFERTYRRLERRYRRVLVWALRHRAVVILMGTAALGFIFFLSFRNLGFEFLPGTDQGQITVNLEMPPGSSLAATDAAARRVETVIKETPDVQAFVTNVGQVLGGFGAIPQQGPQFAQINVRLTDKSSLPDRLIHPGGSSAATRTRSDEAVAQQLRSRLEPLGKEMNARITTTAIRTVEGIAAPIEILVQGSDPQRLAEFAAALRDRMRTTPGILNPDLSARTGQPEIQANADRARAAQFGIPVATIGATVRDALSGNTDTVFRQGGQEFPIRIQLESVQRNDPADVGAVLVGSDSQGQPVTLADVADLVRTTGPTNIDRTNGQRQVTVTANLAANMPLGNAQQAIEQAIASLPHPGIAIQWGGEASTLNENAAYFAEALILAILLVYLVMASLFNSLFTPFVIMFTLPMALIGALGALVLTGETLSLVSAIGIIMLVGLMGRNAILLLDYTNTLRARGAERNAAIENAGAVRLRPILMTTTATIIGMLPVALRIGRASEIRAPMAIVVIGGLIVSSVLTLVMIPVLYSLFDDWFGAGRKTRRKASPAPVENLPRAQNGQAEPSRKEFPQEPEETPPVRR